MAKQILLIEQKDWPVKPSSSGQLGSDPTVHMFILCLSNLLMHRGSLSLSRYKVLLLCKWLLIAITQDTLTLWFKFFSIWLIKKSKLSWYYLPSNSCSSTTFTLRLMQIEIACYLFDEMWLLSIWQIFCWLLRFFLLFKLQLLIVLTSSMAHSNTASLYPSPKISYLHTAYHIMTASATQHRSAWLRYLWILIIPTIAQSHG